MQATPQEILRRSTMSIFKCHFIMIAVSFLLMFFLSSVPWFVTAFYIFMVVSYVFLLYSESVMAARRDFYRPMMIWAPMLNPKPIMNRTI